MTGALRRVLTWLVAPLLAAALTVPLAAPAARAALPPLRDTYGATIDPYPAYQPQSTCTTSVQPGTRALADLLKATYPGTNPAAYVRPCASGGVSEHKDGRAVDWMLDASDPVDRRVAAEFISWLTATDRHGNKNAMARRLGVMYIIWDGALWRGWSGATAGSWDTSRDRGHRDHIHISLSWAGARAQTSFFTAVPFCDTGSSTCPVGRLGGGDRYATSVQVSQAIAPSPAVVVASGRQESLVDGLVAAPLARQVRGPVLLTEPGGLPDVVAEELRRRRPSTAYVVGAPGVVGEEVVRQLEGLGVRVTRLWGADRFATAAAVAQEVHRLTGNTTVALASGAQANLVDALTVGASSAGTGQPLLLTEPSALPATTTAALHRMRAAHVLAVGSESVVAPNVVTDLEGNGLRVTRLGGDDRYRTAVAVAEHHAAAVGRSSVTVSAGLDEHLVDALPAGAMGRLLLPSTRTELPGPVAEWFARNAAAVDRATVVGSEAATGYGVVADLAGVLR